MPMAYSEGQIPDIYNRFVWIVGLSDYVCMWENRVSSSRSDGKRMFIICFIPNPGRPRLYVHPG